MRLAASWSASLPPPGPPPGDPGHAGRPTPTSSSDTFRAVDSRLDHGAIGNGRLIALVAPTTAIEWLCLPRFDSPSVFAALLDPERGGRFQFLAGGEAVRGEQAYLPNTNVLRTEIAVRHPLYFMLSYGHRPSAPTESDIMLRLEETVRGWRMWSKTCALPSFAPDHVLRSALCLKLHAYVDTGAIIAAATTSIPEALGTERTWDYRYCWLRDAAFVVEALRRMSHLNEGEALMRYVRDLVESGPLQPVYGIGG